MSRTIWLITLITILLSSAAAFADGIIIINPPYPYPIPEPWPWRYHPPPKEAPRSLDIKYHRVDVSIDEQLCVTEIDEMFHNPYSVELEGTYIFPLPEGAAIDNFSLKIDGKEVYGEMLDADEAASAYSDLVRENGDPAILEYVGRGAFRARIYPIAPHSDKRVEIAYSEVLPYDAGMVKYEYPLDTERFSAIPLEDVSVKVRIDSKSPVKTIYSPTHNVEIKRDDDGATVEFSEKETKPDRDFVLYYSVSSDEIATSMITYEPDEGDGYFLLLITPPEIDTAETPPKEVILVMDTSGSMGGEKIEQVKEALDYCLVSLSKKDKFNLITFSDEPRLFAEKSVPVNSGNIDEAKKFVKNIKAKGGTNIDEALIDAVSSVSGDNGPVYVLFLTDGKPTVGIRDASEIILNYKERNKDIDARLFSFGVGYKVNVNLLDSLSSENGGVTGYVKPGESVEIYISNLYDKIAKPVLADYEIDYGDMKVSSIYPSLYNDIFAGTQLSILGRYEGDYSGGAFKISGTRAGKSVDYSYELPAAKKKDARFIEPLWAARKIGYLLDQIRLYGNEEELKEEVIALSKQYGIVTPYTSYLVGNTTDKISRRGSDSDFDSLIRTPGIVTESSGFGNGNLHIRGGRGGSGGGISMNDTTTTRKIGAGEARVIASESISELKSSDIITSSKTDAEMRHIGEKIFVKEGDFWVDLSIGETDVTLDEIRIEYGSDEYFDFISQNPKLASYFSLGSKVKFSHNNTVIIIE